MSAAAAGRGRPNPRQTLTGALLFAAILAAGCASQSASIRSLPPENPAADKEAAAESAAAFASASAGGGEGAENPPGPADSGGASGGGRSAVGASGPQSAGNGAQASGPPASPEAAAQTPPPTVTPQDAPPMQTYDPWERYNRFVYRFNARFDEAIFLPVSNTYRRIPAPLRSGVHNFFANLSEVDSTVNYVLQGRFLRGLRSVGRFVVNSTVGIGGLIDVASRIKLTGSATGWGNTLATWGVHPGPYFVIPLLGPSTLRDGFGYLADYGTSYAIDVARLYRGDASWGLAVANAVDQRANNSFRYYASGSAFEYENIRFLYVRKTLIEDDALRARGRKVAPGPVRHNPDDPAGK